ncbi:Peptidase_M15_4 domain-containing protein [Vibrio chagasii]|nr:Peptidase_M15_4 domain-containing protein [Vibrio chagasii]CAH6951681.1 Peptidase_M15_4 domain-containing protein [Vibrio chagasii]CAH6960544.1 Peptidase_M15_4 domain-containing protein [Vibrio chagasii]CAH7033909.1 Peptidase_M15_4 domain-containing protein [Vibrio chagasii]CAH7123341.1 Peptidase_M15_4 domain-containing protein [Vibrio chagasii]
MRWLMLLASGLLAGVYLMNKRTIDETVSDFVLSARSETRMLGVHGDLKKVVRRALELSPYDFGITEGLRTAKRQYQLYQEGLSQLDGAKRLSRHQSGHAIDFVAYDENNKVTWDFKYYAAISRAFKQAAREMNVAIVWGGDWKSLKDGPHIELSRRVYT